VTFPLSFSLVVIGLLRVTGLVLWSVLAGGPVAAFLNIFGAGVPGWSRIYFSVVAKIINLKIVVHGQQSECQPLLMASNHVSYMDIVALGAKVGTPFAAKAEIAKWPGLGLLAKVGNSVFINRDRRATKNANNDVYQELNRGGRLILFPEATSSDGNHILPFKSALFAVTEHTIAGRPVVVQPVALAYTRINGLPAGVIWRPFLAWYGDMDLLPHLWEAAKIGQKTIEINFLPTVTLADCGDRKALAHHCESAVRSAFNSLLKGQSHG